VEHPDATGRAYNIACAESVTLNQLFQMMRDRLAAQDARFSTVIPQHDPFRPGDIRFSCASIENARQLLSFAPTHSVAQGLEEAMDWYMEKAHMPAGRVAAVANSQHAPLSVNPSHRGTASFTLAAP
jgi:UDP-N-acetylglucosamine 4-epimerase